MVCAFPLTNDWLANEPGFYKSQIENALELTSLHVFSRTQINRLQLTADIFVLYNHRILKKKKKSLCGKTVQPLYDSKFSPKKKSVLMLAPNNPSINIGTEFFLPKKIFHS